jgi:hypothetical protein
MLRDPVTDLKPRETQVSKPGSLCHWWQKAEHLNMRIITKFKVEVRERKYKFLKTNIFIKEWLIVSMTLFCWNLLLLLKGTLYGGRIQDAHQYVSIDILWYKHAGSCRAREKFKRTTRRSRVFMSQYRCKRSFIYIAFIKFRSRSTANLCIFKVCCWPTSLYVWYSYRILVLCPPSVKQNKK